jgi:hypothetical protein
VSSHNSVLLKYMAPGKMLEFRQGDGFVLGVIQESAARRPSASVQVTAVDALGVEHTVRASQVVVVLPGKEYTREDVKRVEEQVRV